MCRNKQTMNACMHTNVVSLVLYMFQMNSWSSREKHSQVNFNGYSEIKQCVYARFIH